MYKIIDKPREGILHSNNIMRLTYHSFIIDFNVDNGKVEVRNGTHYFSFWVNEPLAGDDIFDVFAAILPLVKTAWNAYLESKDKIYFLPI